MKADILIKNGRLIDPAAGIDGVCDVAIQNKKVVCCRRDIPAGEALYVVDAAGCVVTPGLIDSHCHFFSWGTDIGCAPDAAFLPNGVTAAVDAGSAGIANYEALSRLVTGASRMKLQAYLNVSPAGLTAATFGDEPLDPPFFREDSLIGLYERCPEIIGFKVRISRNIVKENGLEPLARAVRIAERCGAPVHVHTTDAPEPVDRVLSLLRKGDWFSHCFHDTGNGILNAAGKIDPAVFAARERGVLFDSARGRIHFAWRTAEEAFREGFLPDTISTDLIAQSMFRRPVFSLPFVMSEYLCLGLTLPQVVERVTARPAELIGMKGQIGTLAPGAWGDAAVFRLAEDRRVEFTDVAGETRIGARLLIPQMTVLDGEIAYRQIDF